MTEEKKALLVEQVEKIKDVMNVLNQQFAEDFEDEKNFLSIVMDNLLSATK